jgi:CRISPR system Cascade subunit CasD
MQSWGVRSRWDVRDTALEPTKSGIVGLMGCAMGLNRDDPKLEELDCALRYGVRIDRPGVISMDYHTVTGYLRTAAGEFKHSGGTRTSLAKAHEHKEATIVSHRDYLHDAAFLVALEGERALLQKLKEHLINPKWPIYLGRKSCVPSRPILDRLTDEYEDLESALRREPWAVGLSHRREKTPQKTAPVSELTAWIECLDGEYERQDAIRLNQLRFYDFRRCKRIEIDTRTLPWRIA